LGKIKPKTHTRKQLLKGHSARVKSFQNHLISKKFSAFIRKNRGTDILGVCGQLAARSWPAPRPNNKIRLFPGPDSEPEGAFPGVKESVILVGFKFAILSVFLLFIIFLTLKNPYDICLTFLEGILSFFLPGA